MKYPKENEDGSWIALYNGGWIVPLKPDPKAIDIYDIAHSLALQCRFTGHTTEFYSTAQHSYYVSLIVPKEDALWGLLHDASETYVSDVARPIKHSLSEFGDMYRSVEEVLAKAVAERFGLPWPEPDSVKRADKMMLRAEQRDLMPNDPEPLEAWEGKVEPWDWRFAEKMFLKRYAELTGESVTLPKDTRMTLKQTLRSQKTKKKVGIEA